MNKAQKYSRHALVPRRGFWADGKIRGRNGNIIAEVKDNIYSLDNLLGAVLTALCFYRKIHTLPTQQSHQILYRTFKDEEEMQDRLNYFKRPPKQH